MRQGVAGETPTIVKIAYSVVKIPHSNDKIAFSIVKTAYSSIKIAYSKDSILEGLQTAKTRSAPRRGRRDPKALFLKS